MNHFKVAITYTDHKLRPVCIATVSDRGKLSKVARQILADGDAKAKRLADADPVLGQLEAEENHKLRRIFESIAGIDLKEPERCRRSKAVRREGK